MVRSIRIPASLMALAVACGGAGIEGSAAGRPRERGNVLLAAEIPSTSSTSAGAARLPRPDTSGRTFPPNEVGRIPVLEYHLVGDKDARWERQRDRFRQDLELLYARDYRPVTVGELVDRKLDLPEGKSPVVFTFDDASPGQFRYIERDGKLEIDPTSAIGIWLDFNKQHPDWGRKATFCMLPAAQAGHAFFGDKGIQGQKTEWRFAKVRFLAEQGFELCNHTLWHGNLAKYDDAHVQEQVARGELAVDSAVSGYRVRTFALPLGVWPKNRALAQHGSWRDPQSGRVVTYKFDAVLEVAGPPARSPFDPQFDPLSIPRVQVFANTLEQTLDQLDRAGTRYVSDGDPNTVAKPTAIVGPVAPAKVPAVAPKRAATRRSGAQR